jgi:hypothetical protein
MKYTIAKKEHYSFPPFPILAFGKFDIFTVEFSKECVHFQKEDDIHKLWGRSNKWDREIDSFRIGWRSDGEVIELYAYEHLPELGYGKEKWTKIGYCYPSQKIRFRLQYSKIGTTTHLNGIYVHKSKFVSNLVAFRCRPYYGGNITAPTRCQLHIYFRIFR